MQTCPSGYAPDPTQTFCMQCDQLCSTCAGSSTNCSACQSTIIIGSTLTNIYLVDAQNQCVTSCPLNYFKTTVSGQKICKLCDSYCTTCAVALNNCTVCQTTALVGGVSSPIYKV